jgi:ribosomal protein S18 acetylase RimI-like enzyme
MDVGPVRRNKKVRYRQLVEIPDQGFMTFFLMELQYDKEIDWYEIRMYQGRELVGYIHGYANQGWNPQVNNVWVTERFRRRKIASLMMSKIEAYFGQVPMPGTPIENNKAARGFWDKFNAKKAKGGKEQQGDPWFGDGEIDACFRQFVAITGGGFNPILLLEIRHDSDRHLFEVRVLRGRELLAYIRGQASQDWNPQVDNVWVSQRFRRMGIASLMLSKTQDYFGQMPLPSGPIDDNPAARGLWKKYTSGRTSPRRKKSDTSNGS